MTESQTLLYVVRVESQDNEGVVCTAIFLPPTNVLQGKREDVWKTGFADGKPVSWRLHEDLVYHCDNESDDVRGIAFNYHIVKISNNSNRVANQSYIMADKDCLQITVIKKMKVVTHQITQFPCYQQYLWMKTLKHIYSNKFMDMPNHDIEITKAKYSIINGDTFPVYISRIRKRAVCCVKNIRGNTHADVEIRMQLNHSEVNELPLVKDDDIYIYDKAFVDGSDYLFSRKVFVIT